MEAIRLFTTWLDEAHQCGLREPTAMSLATVDPCGKPHVRMVLLKEASEAGFAFYTNLGSPKATDLTTNGQAALCFYWMPLGKQVRVEGNVLPVSAEEANAYFATRPRLSQLGAWASRQSTVMEHPLDLEKEVAKAALRFGVGKVPRPPFWSGFRLAPDLIEFWEEKPFRRHERMRYLRSQGKWKKERLFP